MKRETAKLIVDAEDACREIQDLCAGVTKQDFQRSRLLNLALTKLTENIGEALKQAEQTDPVLVGRIPELRQIIGTRNRLIHRYDDVDYDLLWDIATKEVPPLRQELRRLLDLAPPLREPQ